MSMAMQRDAITRGLVPGAVVRMTDDTVVQLTSYPWQEEIYPYSYMIMARTTIGDATTNKPVDYYSISTLINIQPL